MISASRNILAAIATLIALGALPLMASASDLETLMMPGKVIQGHAKWEADCKKCHESFSKKMQNRRCLACHKKVAADIRQKLGFHGRINGVTSSPCKLCHTDHKGRDADIVHLDSDIFDHRQTDFPLKGAHHGLACGSCHEKGKKYRDAPSACNDCHAKNDPHKGRLGKACEKCHSVTAWKSKGFDHDKTKFPLHGAHKKASCNSCHPNEHYKNLATACVACHGINDVHTGRYGDKCKKCHNDTKWTDIIFDHDKDTKYKLNGVHRTVKCDTCHTGKLYTDKLGTSCYSCHKHDDKHNGRFDKKCENCHSTRDWKHNDFNHDKDTKFLLRGAHKKVSCQDCHRGSAVDEKTRTSCYSCHRDDDVHKGKEGKQCERCHNEERWDKKVVFDHDMTHFPLIGLHAGVPCEECHLNTSYKVPDYGCNSCHSNDDTHKRTLGANCVLCHNPNGWRIWRFDHNTQTHYKLEGAHSKVLCHACHREPVKDKIHLAKTCGACHQGDDVHNGGFGQQCERCHTTESFKHVRFSGLSAIRP